MQSMIYNPHTTCRLWAPRSAASCKKWSQTTKLSSGPPSHHGFFTVIERVLLSVHRDMTAVTQCMATICVSTCLRTSFWFVFYLIMPIWFVFYLMLPICSIFTSTSSPEHPQDRAAHTWDVLKVLSDRDACLHTVTWFSATHTWTSRRALGVGLISFCLLKCVQMDVLGMVALETSRARGAGQGRVSRAARSREHTRQVQMFSLHSERFSCSAHSSSSRRCSSKLLPTRAWPSQGEKPHLCPGRGELGFP